MTDAFALPAALEGLARGWSVIPLCPHDHVGVGRVHRGCKSPGKRPFFPNKPDSASGEWKEFQSRLPTEAEVRGWYEAHPGLNLGIALGPVSGIVAIDIDDEEGEQLLEAMAQGDLPKTWEYTTGKGRRLMYRIPEGVHVRTNSFTRPGTEIEILRLMGRGSQIVLPPSIHPNESTYTWKTLCGPDDMPAANVPAWMVALPVPDSSNRAAPADSDMIGEGGRNNYLTSLAGAMRKRGADEEAIFAALSSTNDRRCDPPLDEVELKTISRSVARYEPDGFTGVTIKMPTTEEKSRLKDIPVADYVRNFKWASELSAPNKEDEWIWKGYLARSGITLLSALWKIGKTTLLSHLLKSLGTNCEFLGQEIKASKVLYVTEEGEQHWVRRRDDLGIGDHSAFYLQPFSQKPENATWISFVTQLKADVKFHGFDLIVIDTLAKLWPVKNENDPAEVDSALMPFWEITKLGAGVLLIHHMRKSGGGEYTASRGSGAISAFADILMELANFDAMDRKCRRRVIRAKGRYDDTPDEITIELADNNQYERVIVSDEPEIVIGPLPGDYQADKEETKILSVLQRAKTDWLTVDGIREGLRAISMGMRAEDVTSVLSSLVMKSLVSTKGRLRSKMEPKMYALRSRASDESSHSAPGGESGNEIRDGDTPETISE